jgi:hypothetical protein
MATVFEIVDDLRKQGIEIECVCGNQYLMQIQAQSKKKPAWIKTAVPEEWSQELMRQSCGQEGDFMLCLLRLPKTATFEAAKRIDAESGGAANA